MSKFLIFPDLEAKGNLLCNKPLKEDFRCLGAKSLLLIQIKSQLLDDFQLTSLLPKEDFHFRKKIKSSK